MRVLGTMIAWLDHYGESQMGYLFSRKRNEKSKRRNRKSKDPGHRANPQSINMQILFPDVLILVLSELLRVRNLGFFTEKACHHNA